MVYIASSIYSEFLQTFEEDVVLEHFSIPKCIPLKAPKDKVCKNTTFDTSKHFVFIAIIIANSFVSASGHFPQSAVFSFYPTLNEGPN